jgi:hypothetical protein
MKSDINIESELNSEIIQSKLTAKSSVRLPQKRKPLSLIDNTPPHNKIETIIDSNHTIMKTSQESFENSVTFRSFSLKIPKWGGVFEVNESDFGELYSENTIYNDMPIINTCTIDYLLLAVWSSHFLSSKVREVFINRENDFLIKFLNKIVDLIENPNANWNRAKTIWTLIVTKLIHNNSLEFDCWESTYKMFWKYFEQHQKIQFKCEKCHNLVRSDQVALNLVKDSNNNCFIDLHEFKKCLECNLLVNGKFVSKPFCLFVDICEKAHNKINIDDIPLQLTIDGTGYHFLCVTLFVNENHFKAIFRLNGQNYLIDDLKAGFNKKIPKNVILGTVFYYLR